MINLVETFISPNGEGLTTGLMTLFVRIAGCNFAEEGHPCSFCDTAYAWLKKDGHLSLSVKNFVDMIHEIMVNTNLREICITGGEPLSSASTITALDHLKKLNYHITVETNGSIAIWEDDDILWSLDIKCPSSGNAKYNVYDNLSKLKNTDQVKFIIANQEDFAFAVNKLPMIPKGEVIFQPSYSELTHSRLIDMIKSNKDAIRRVRVGTQCHKLWYPGVVKGV